MSDAKELLLPDMTVLDVVSRHRQTEAVFKSYDAQVGEWKPSALAVRFIC